MCHTNNFNGAYNRQTKTYDFKPAFTNIEKYISKADIAIGNLETTFAGEERGYTGYPNANSPKELAEALKEIGIDVLSTANNHSLDKGYDGLESTLNILDEIGMEHTGTARSKEEQNTVLIKEVNGIKIAFIAFTYGVNSIQVPAGKEYSVNLIEEDVILNQIKLAREQKADIICASMHWGESYKEEQTEDQEDLANYLFRYGVDIIIGNHPHKVQQIEKKVITMDDGSEKEVFVAYSLGNFLTGQTDEQAPSSAIIDIQIRKSGQTGKISIDDVDYVPVYCHDKGISKDNRYELVDMRKAIGEYESGNTENVSLDLYKVLKNEFANIVNVIGKSNITD